LGGGKEKRKPPHSRRGSRRFWTAVLEGPGREGGRGKSHNSGRKKFLMEGGKKGSPPFREKALLSLAKKKAGKGGGDLSGGKERGTGQITS